MPATRKSPTPLARSSAVCWMVLSLLSPARGAAADVKRPPHRLVPARGLIAYAEFGGLDAHAGAWEATSAHAMLRGTSAGAMMTELARQVTDRLLKTAPGGDLDGADVLALHDHLARHGFALAVYAHENNASSSVLVLGGVGRKGTRERFDRLLRLFIDPKGGTRLPAPARLRNRDVFQLVEKASAGIDSGPPLARREAGQEKAATAGAAWLSWWFEGDDVVLVANPSGGSAFVTERNKEKPASATHTDRVAALLDVIEGKAPGASTHPDYAAALAEGKDIQGFEPDGLFFVASGKGMGLFRSLLEGIGVVDRPYRGLTLPSGRYLHDDVKPFGPGLTSLPLIPIPPDDENFPLPVPSPQAPTTPYDGGDEATPALQPLPEPTPAPAPLISLPTLPGGKVQTDVPLRVAPGTRGDEPGKIPGPGPLVPAGGEPKGTEPAAAPPSALTKPGPTPVPERLEDGKGEVKPGHLLGIDGIKRVVGRWGFQGKSLVTDVRIELPAPRKGLFGLLDQPDFPKRRLPPIPKRVRAFSVGTFDLGQSYPRLTGLLKALGPQSGDQIARVEEVFRESTGLRLREDLFSHLGPLWSAFALPSAVPVGGDPLRVDPADYVLVCGVDDAGAFGKTLDTVASRFNESLRKLEADDGKGEPVERDTDAPILALERLKAPDRGYQLTSPAALVPWLGAGLRPTVLIGESFIAFASNPEKARDALAGESRPRERWEPTGELVEAFDRLPNNLSFLSVGDPLETAWVEGIVKLPATVQTLSSLVGDFGDPETPSASNLLAAFGVPKPGGFRVRIAPAQVPTADDLRAHLFPSVLAVTVDESGLRLIGREAFPLACLGETVSLKSSMTWSNTKGFKRKVTLSSKFGLGNW